MSGLRPAWNWVRALDSLVMTVNFGLLCGWLLTYAENIACPPSLPYPGQSSTCSRPDSEPSQSYAACAVPRRPPRRLAPPAAAAIFRSCSRLSRRFSTSCSSIRSSFVPLVAGRADDPHHLCKLLAGVRDAVGCRAAVVDAVAALELEELAAELQLHGPGDDDEELLGVPVRVGLLAGRPSHF